MGDDMTTAPRAIGKHIIIIAALAGWTAGCADNLHHRDAVTTHAGDAQAANIALQMIDPWPPEAAITDIESDGERGVKAIENYRKGGADTSDNSAGAVGITLIPSTGGAPE